MIYIYQIGRLDKDFYKSVRFRIENYEIDSPLSSLALAKYFKEIGKKEVKNIILYPSSLFLNFGVLNKDSRLIETYKESLYTIINSKSVDFNKLDNFFRDLTVEYYSPEAVHGILYSLGKYKSEDKKNEIDFDTTLDDLVLQVFVDMYNTISIDQDVELYLDISSGLNLYISALIEGAKNFWTFFNLQNWGKKTIKIFFVFSEPISKDLTQTHNIYYNNEIRYRYFFECPIEKDSITCICDYIHEKLFNNYIEQDKVVSKEDLRDILEKLVLTYNALKYNVPLFFLTFQLPKVGELKRIVNKIISNLYLCMYNRDLKSSPRLDRSKIMRVILSLAFFIGIKSVLDETDIYNNEQIDNKMLEAFFEKIYNTLGLNLNKIYLSSELGIIQSKIAKILREINDENLKENLLNITMDYFTIERIDNIIKTNQNVKEEIKQLIKCINKNFDPKSFYSRNFFAHAGFEKNVTLIKIIGESLAKGSKNIRFSLSYKQEALDKIKEELYKL